MQDNRVTNKTAKEILAASPENLTEIEQVIQKLMSDYGMTLEQAIQSLDELP